LVIFPQDGAGAGETDLTSETEAMLPKFISWFTRTTSLFACSLVDGHEIWKTWIQIPSRKKCNMSSTSLLTNIEREMYTEFPETPSDEKIIRDPL
jgi:hypothetical protein